MDWSTIFSVAWYYNSNTTDNWILIIGWICLIFIYLQIICSLNKHKWTSQHINISQNNHQYQPSKINMVLTMIFYIILYSICILITGLYIISESLPTDNTLKLNEYTIYFIQKFISFILSISNAFIIPRMVDCIHQFCAPQYMTFEYRSYIIFILRTYQPLFIIYIFHYFIE